MTSLKLVKFVKIWPRTCPVKRGGQLLAYYSVLACVRMFAPSCDKGHKDDAGVPVILHNGAVEVLAQMLSSTSAERHCSDYDFTSSRKTKSPDRLHGVQEILRTFKPATYNTEPFIRRFL